MKRRLLVRPRATADIDEAVNWLAPQSLPAATGFLDAVEQAFALLSERPEIGSPRYAHLLPDLAPRMWPLTGYPYLVFYLLRTDTAEVIRVLHGHRDLPPQLTESE